MPTYKNNTSETRLVENTSGVPVYVKPGEEIQTYSFLTGGWEELSELPLYSPVLFKTEVALNTNGVDFTFDPYLTKFIRVHSVSGVINQLYISSTNIEPLFENITSATKQLPEIDNSLGRIKRIILKGVGTCILLGYSATIKMFENTFEKSSNLSSEQCVSNMDYDGNGNILYYGIAVPGSLDSEAKWKIYKYTYNASGKMSKTRLAQGETAFNKVWDLRTTYTYS